MNGGQILAEVLHKHHVPFLFTLCGGHISPILVESEKLGIRIVDVRHEVNAVFAADAVARMTGIPGVAAVTAGPGVTNTLTAIKNAQLAQSPLVLLGGAAATILRGRGSLQDIDQMSMMKPNVKWCKSAKNIRQLGPLLEEAFYVAQDGVPGPVFLECPIDLLYHEELVRDWYGAKSDEQPPRNMQERVIKWYVKRHVNKVFAGKDGIRINEPSMPTIPTHSASQVRSAVKRLEQAKNPVLLIGSQTLLQADKVEEIAKAVENLGIPVYLSGMGRGLLGKDHPLQLRHKRRNALKEADLVILSGVPCDFRLDYGQHIRGKAFLISANRSKEDLNKNRRPNLGILGDPGQFLLDLASQSNWGSDKWNDWLKVLRERDDARNANIAEQASVTYDKPNPIYLSQEIEKVVDDDSIFVVDGGDFVATASYVVSPRSPLSWLDPGVFGTLGVGGGFALGAKLVRPSAEVWLIYGDGSAAYSIAEYDTFARHQLPVISVIGNDASWAQIARDQIEILKADTGTVLAHSDYHKVAEGYGGKGILIERQDQIEEALAQAIEYAKNGHPVTINSLIAKTDFRKGSISM